VKRETREQKKIKTPSPGLMHTCERELEQGRSRRDNRRAFPFERDFVASSSLSSAIFVRFPMDRLEILIPEMCLVVRRALITGSTIASTIW
jgi:hypothetical protein